MDYAIWLRELKKYRDLIDLTKHVLFERAAGRKIDHLLPSLQKIVDECQFTTIKISGNEGRPLSSIESMFQNHLPDKDIQHEIKAAEEFWTKTTSDVQRASSGKYQHNLRSFQDESDVHSAFQNLGAKLVEDYLVIAFTVYLFDRDERMFKALKEWLIENK